MTDPTIAERYADFAAGLRFEDVPPALIEKAKLHILDTLGCAIAAARTDFAESMTAGFERLGEGGDAVAIGQDRRFGLRDAILFNGGLANTLDYDDTYTPTLNHISGGAAPLVLAVGAREGAPGRDVLAAYLIAIEIGAYVGLGVGGNAIMRRGFSPTGTLNGFGNSLAAGRLLGLDRDALVAAQGIAVTFMSGSMEGIREGAWSKRLNSGLGAAAGLNAAVMAAGGVHAPSRPYEGDAGLYRLLLGPDAEVDWPALTDGLGSRWEFEKVAIKPFPLVHHAHSIVDAAIRLNREDGLGPDDIDSITVLVNERQVPLLCEPDAEKRHPPNAHAGIFSIYHLVATAVARGRMTLDECEEEALHDPAIEALRERIKFEIDPDSLFPRYFSGGLTAHLRDGRRIARYEPHHLGSDKRPLPDDAVIDKFRHNAGRLYGADRVETIRDAVMALDGDGTPAAVTALLGAP
ncbi:MAG: MmgE/PrpD family protein [Alphaproteobacteria bacterium]|nr:MmgE/PrpD family protein [Alphaproteobacteria bacterium]